MTRTSRTCEELPFERVANAAHPPLLGPMVESACGSMHNAGDVFAIQCPSTPCGMVGHCSEYGAKEACGAIEGGALEAAALEVTFGPLCVAPFVVSATP